MCSTVLTAVTTALIDAVSTNESADQQQGTSTSKSYLRKCLST